MGPGPGRADRCPEFAWTSCTSTPGVPGRPPGRAEVAQRALALVRRAAERGYNDFGATTAFFGPVLGHLSYYRQFMTDMNFPANPFP